MPKFSVTKSTTIDAPIDKVFSNVRDLKQWRAWSPWVISEPDCPISYADDGMSYSWEGKIIGTGQLEILSEDAPNRIDYRLTFLKPWKSVADTSFSFAEKNGSVEATWTLDSSLPFFMFFFKKMMVAFVGMDYERGLSMLKPYVETGENPSKLEFIGKEAFGGCSYVGVRTECPIPDIGLRMGEDRGKVTAWLAESGTEACGKPFSIYHKWSPVKGIVAYTTAVPLESAPAAPPSGFVSGSIPACEVYSVKHTGPYSFLGNAWSSGVMHAQNKVYRKNNRIHPFETYENDPAETDEKDLVTIVHFAVKP